LELTKRIQTYLKALSRRLGKKSLFVRRTKTTSKTQTVELSNVKKTLPTVIITLYLLIKSNGKRER